MDEFKKERINFDELGNVAHLEENYEFFKPKEVKAIGLYGNRNEQVRADSDAKYTSIHGVSIGTYVVLYNDTGKDTVKTFHIGLVVDKHPTEFSIKWMYAPNERTGKYKVWTKQKVPEKVNKSRFMIVMTEKDFTGKTLKAKHLNVIDKVLDKLHKKEAGQAVEEKEDKEPKDKVDRELLMIPTTRSWTMKTTAIKNRTLTMNKNK